MRGPPRRSAPLVGLALAIMSAAGAPAARADPDCVWKVKVTAERISADVTIDKALSSLELSRDYAARHLEDRQLHLLGGETVIDRRIAYHYEPVAGIAPGGVCLQPPTISIRIEDASRTVRVAREVAADACLEREVLAHERRHVRASASTTDTAIADAQRSFDAFAAARMPRGGPALATSPRAVATLVAAWFTAWEKQLGDAIARENALVDSPEEYQRFPTVCDGRAGALAARTLAQLTEPPVVAKPAAVPSQPFLSAMSPDAPVFAGTIDPITTPIALGQRPFGERVLVSVRSSAGPPTARRPAWSWSAG
jgi:hypothetical protein